MTEYITRSRAETVALGRQLARVLPPGALIAFTGSLGAGKTAFCQGLAEGLGCTDPVSSPTFAIVNYYRGPQPFAHFDLYRIHTEPTWPRPGSMITLTAARLSQPNGAKTAPTCSRLKSRSALTLRGWTTARAGSPSMGPSWPESLEAGPCVVPE